MPSDTERKSPLSSIRKPTLISSDNTCNKQCNHLTITNCTSSFYMMYSSTTSCTINETFPLWKYSTWARKPGFFTVWKKWGADSTGTHYKIQSVTRNTCRLQGWLPNEMGKRLCWGSPLQDFPGDSSLHPEVWVPWLHTFSFYRTRDSGRWSHVTQLWQGDSGVILILWSHWVLNWLFLNSSIFSDELLPLIPSLLFHRDRIISFYYILCDAKDTTQGFMDSR